MKTANQSMTKISQVSKFTGRTRKSKKKMPARPKPQVTKEQLKALIHGVFAEADEDGNGDLDIDECRVFLKKLMARTYPEREWCDEQFKTGFYGIDINKGGSIDFEELFLHVYKNAFRQGMVTGSEIQKKQETKKKKAAAMD